MVDQNDGLVVDDYAQTTALLWPRVLAFCAAVDAQRTAR